MEELQAELLEELQVEMKVDETELPVLSIKLKNAIREVIASVNFPSYWEEDKKVEYTKLNYIGNIKDLTMYDYSLVGGEGELIHAENGTERTFKSRSDCFKGIVRFADI